MFFAAAAAWMAKRGWDVFISWWSARLELYELMRWMELGLVHPVDETSEEDGGPQTPDAGLE